MTLGIIAGEGRLPAQLIDACQSVGREVFVLAFDTPADPVVAGAAHRVVRLGAVGEALDALRRAGVSELVLAGKIQRPSLASLKPDALGAKLLARMSAAFFGGDDALLKAVVGFLEDEGFRVIGAEEILSELIAPKGVLGRITPDPQAQQDIAKGLKIVRRLGDLDIGQAVVVCDGYVLGVEAAEGTDALITRCGALRRSPRGGVLVKAKKPGQESRVDLPTIGVSTVETAHAAGLVGIAVESGGSLVLDRAATLARADALGIFIVGMSHD